jgi:hypothetical protein
MSVTFSLPREFRVVTQEDHKRARAVPCPGCGGHDRYAELAIPRVEGDHNCDTCYGDGGNHDVIGAVYGRDAREDGEFNVADGNAAYIVQDLLNLRGEEAYGGALAPHLILSRLATVFDTANGVEEGSETQGVILTADGVAPGATVINCGRSQRQCDSYVSRLRRLAEIAQERGAPEIIWG